MKHQAEKPLKKSRKIQKLILLFFILAGLGYLVFSVSQDQKDLNQIIPLQTDIQTLRAQVRQLESAIQEINERPLSNPTSYTKKDLIKLILWHQFITEVWSGRPYKDSLDQLREVAALELEKIPQVKSLLEHASQGIPTIEYLWLIIDEPQENSSASLLEDEKSFWVDPLKYFQSQFSWNKFFIVTTQTNESVRRKIKKFIAQKNFAKALNALKESEQKLPALEDALNLLENVNFSLKILEERIIQSLVSGEPNEK